MTTILAAYGWEGGNSMVPGAYSAGSGGASTDKAKTGSYSLRIGGVASNYMRFAISGSLSELAFSVWCHADDEYSSNGSNTHGVSMSVLLTSGHYVGLYWDGANHTLDAYVDGAKVADGTVFVLDNDWFHVQAYIVIDNSAGSIQVKINGHESISYTGQDTQPGATSTIDYLHLSGGGNYSDRSYFDDLVWGTGGYLGDLRCYEKRPDGDGTVTWSPSAGTDNYAMVDETPQSDSDYNETPTDGNADELDLEDFVGSEGAPVAIMAWVRARQDAGSGDSIKVGVDSGGTDDVSAAQALSDSWQYFTHTLDDNPADSEEWADADIDALKLRYEAVIP